MLVNSNVLVLHGSMAAQEHGRAWQRKRRPVLSVPVGVLWCCSAQQSLQHCYAKYGLGRVGRGI
jgi:hypothetical protein